MTRVFYLTHPQVVIDPAVPVPNWGLNETGLARAQMLASSGALDGVRHIISSTETKALETARPVADKLGLAVETAENLHENDRSATGFLPPSEFETTADAFFANPNQSIRGWETAQDAQTRIVTAVKSTLPTDTKGDVLYVGHGAVGTLLWCALSGVPISRAHDQGGGGHIYMFAPPFDAPDGPWRSIEDFIRAQRPPATKA